MFIIHIVITIQFSYCRCISDKKKAIISFLLLVINVYSLTQVEILLHDIHKPLWSDPVCLSKPSPSSLPVTPKLWSYHNNQYSLDLKHTFQILWMFISFYCYLYTSIFSNFLKMRGCNYSYQCEVSTVRLSFTSAAYQFLKK